MKEDDHFDAVQELQNSIKQILEKGNCMFQAGKDQYYTVAADTENKMGLENIYAELHAEISVSPSATREAGLFPSSLPDSQNFLGLMGYQLSPQLELQA